MAGSCRHLQPEAPGPTAKSGLRADKHFLLPCLGGLDRDAVVSGSQGATAFLKARQGPVRLYRGSSKEPRASLRGRTSCGPAATANASGMAGASRQAWQSTLWSLMPSPGLDHAP